MAFQSVSGGLLIPMRMTSSSLSFVNVTLDAAAEKLAFILRVGKAGTIDKVGFLTANVATGDTMDIRLETVDLTNGEPTGTLLDTNSNGALVIGDGDDSTWLTTTLTTGPTVTEGQLIAVVIVNGSGGGNMSLRTVAFDRANFPYSSHFTTAWAILTNSRGPLCALEYSDGSYEHALGVWPVSALAAATFNNTDDPDHIGLKFKLPFPAKIRGVWIVVDPDANLEIVLYDSDGTTELSTVDLDVGPRNVNGRVAQLVALSSSVELSKDTFYRIVVRPTTATDVAIDYFDVNAVAIMDAMPGGQDFHYTTKKDAGWTDTTTRRPIISLILDALDDGAGGGGGVRNPLGGPV